MSVVFEEDFTGKTKKYLLKELDKKQPLFRVETVLLYARLDTGRKNCQLGSSNYKLPDDYIIISLVVNKKNSNLNGAYGMYIELGSSEHDRSPLRCSTVFNRNVVNEGGVSCLLKARTAGAPWVFINHSGRESGVTVEVWISFLTAS